MQVFEIENQCRKDESKSQAVEEIVLLREKPKVEFWSNMEPAIFVWHYFVGRVQITGVFEGV